jgi:hypothetical protein
MDNKSDGNFSNDSIEVPASSKQTASTPNDVSSAGVESKSMTDTTGLLAENEPAKASTAQPIPKKMGNRNAVRHGLYSKYVTLPWESDDDFNCLLQELRDEWKPNGCSEEQAVFSLAHLTLLKWRAIASVQLDFFKSTVSNELKSGGLSWDEIVRHQNTVPAHARVALTAATTLIDDLMATHEKIRSLPYWTDTSDGKEVQRQLMHLRDDVNTLIQQTKKDVIDGVKALVKTVEESAGRFEEAYQADKIEKQLDLAGKFDAKIEKAVRLLVQIKVFKRVDVANNPTPPLLESPSMVPVDGPTERSSAEPIEAEAKNAADAKPTDQVAPQKGVKPKAD